MTESILAWWEKNTRAPRKKFIVNMKKKQKRKDSSYFSLFSSFFTLHRFSAELKSRLRVSVCVFCSRKCACLQPSPSFLSSECEKRKWDTKILNINCFVQINIWQLILERRGVIIKSRVFFLLEIKKNKINTNESSFSRSLFASFEGHLSCYKKTKMCEREQPPPLVQNTKRTTTFHVMYRKIYSMIES